MEPVSPMRDKISMAKNPAAVAQQSYFFREWRKHRDLTQEALSGLTGLTASSISQLESGKQGFTDSTLEALAMGLDCRPGDLLLWAPEDVEAVNAPLTEPAEIQEMLERIDGLLPDNIAALMSAISGFQQANAALSSPARPDDRSERATARRVSPASR